MNSYGQSMVVNENSLSKSDPQKKPLLYKKKFIKIHKEDSLDLDVNIKEALDTLKQADISRRSGSRSPASSHRPRPRGVSSRLEVAITDTEKPQTAKSGSTKSVTTSKKILKEHIELEQFIEMEQQIESEVLKVHVNLGKGAPYPEGQEIEATGLVLNENKNPFSFLENSSNTLGNLLKGVEPKIVASTTIKGNTQRNKENSRDFTKIKEIFEDFKKDFNQETEKKNTQRTLEKHRDFIGKSRQTMFSSNLIMRLIFYTWKSVNHNT